MLSGNWKTQLYFLKLLIFDCSSLKKFVCCTVFDWAVVWCLLLRMIHKSCSFWWVEAKNLCEQQPVLDEGKKCCTQIILHDGEYIYFCKTVSHYLQKTSFQQSLLHDCPFMGDCWVLSLSVHLPSRQYSILRGTCLLSFEPLYSVLFFEGTVHCRLLLRGACQNVVTFLQIGAWRFTWMNRVLQTTMSLTHWWFWWRRSWWWSTWRPVGGPLSACPTCTASTPPPSPAPSTSSTSPSSFGRSWSMLATLRARTFLPGSVCWSCDSFGWGC